MLLSVFVSDLGTEVACSGCCSIHGWATPKRVRNRRPRFLTAHLTEFATAIFNKTVSSVVVQRVLAAERNYTIQAVSQLASSGRVPESRGVSRDRCRESTL